MYVIKYEKKEWHPATKPLKKIIKKKYCARCFNCNKKLKDSRDSSRVADSGLVGSGTF
jgi:hypothetical protein